MTLKEILKTNKKSYTEERQIIFDIIKKIDHFDYSKISNFLEKEGINIGRASIFRTIKLFLEIDIIKIIYNKDGLTIYEYNNDEIHHEHMKCLNCSKIIEFDDSKLHDSFEEIAGKYNFNLKNHSLIFEGICEKCS